MKTHTSRRRFVKAACLTGLAVVALATAWAS